MKLTPTAAAKEAVKRLNGTWHGSYGKARCPAHEDRSPSLSVTPGKDVVLFHCFAGCNQAEIMAALSRHGGYVRPTGGDYTKVSFTYAIHERMQYDYGGRLLQAPALIGT